MGRLLRGRILQIKFINRPTLLIKMTTTSPVAYKARLNGKHSKYVPTFEPNSFQMDQIIADCPTVGKLFPSYGGTYVISHLNSRLRTAVSEIDQIVKNYVSVKHDGKMDIVRKGPQLDELVDNDSYEVVPLENDRLFAGDAYNLRTLITYAMSHKQDIRITVDGPSAPVGTPKYQKPFHKKIIRKK